MWYGMKPSSTMKAQGRRSQRVSVAYDQCIHLLAILPFLLFYLTTGTYADNFVQSAASTTSLAASTRARMNQTRILIRTLTLTVAMITRRLAPRTAAGMLTETAMGVRMCIRRITLMSPTHMSVSLARASDVQVCNSLYSLIRPATDERLIDH